MNKSKIIHIEFIVGVAPIFLLFFMGAVPNLFIGFSDLASGNYDEATYPSILMYCIPPGAIGLYALWNSYSYVGDRRGVLKNRRLTIFGHIVGIFTAFFLVFFHLVKLSSYFGLIFILPVSVSIHWLFLIGKFSEGAISTANKGVN
ncbi:hypothetical protein [Kaarinaea lacus]